MKMTDVTGEDKVVFTEEAERTLQNVPRKVRDIVKQNAAKSCLREKTVTPSKFVVEKEHVIGEWYLTSESDG